jgi:hypothetical protein
MNAIVPHIFEDKLVRSVMRDQQPWFVGRDVCHVLDIRNESHALARLDDDERSEVAISDPSGRKMAIAVSEPGVFRLIFTSRKPEAERFKRWLAHEVLRQSGTYSLNSNPGLLDGAGNPVAMQPLDIAGMDATARMRCVDLSARLYGPEYARQLYRDIGLPRVSVAVPGGRAEAIACLDRIMAGEAFGHCILDLLNSALDDPTKAAEPLRLTGILIDADGESFTIANQSPALEACFKGTKWHVSGWGPTLRRLPGALPTKAKRFGHGIARGTSLPATVLDLLEEL